jgi:hypothetical protein
MRFSVVSVAARAAFIFIHEVTFLRAARSPCCLSAMHALYAVRVRPRKPIEMQPPRRLGRLSASVALINDPKHSSTFRQQWPTSCLCSPFPLRGGLSEAKSISPPPLSCASRLQLVHPMHYSHSLQEQVAPPPRHRAYKRILCERARVVHCVALSAGTSLCTPPRNSQSEVCEFKGYFYPLPLTDPHTSSSAISHRLFLFFSLTVQSCFAVKSQQFILHCDSRWSPLASTQKNSSSPTSSRIDRSFRVHHSNFAVSEI